MTDEDADVIATKAAEKIAEILKRPTLGQIAAAGVDGWACSRCGCEDSRVIRSTFSQEAGGRIRRRVCRNCGKELPPTVERLVAESEES